MPADHVGGFNKLGVCCWVFLRSSKNILRPLHENSGYKSGLLQISAYLSHALMFLFLCFKLFFCFASVHEIQLYIFEH